MRSKLFRQCPLIFLNKSMGFNLTRIECGKRRNVRTDILTFLFVRMPGVIKKRAREESNVSDAAQVWPVGKAFCKLDERMRACSQIQGYCKHLLSHDYTLTHLILKIAPWNQHDYICISCLRMWCSRLRNWIKAHLVSTQDSDPNLLIADSMNFLFHSCSSQFQSTEIKLSS